MLTRNLESLVVGQLGRKASETMSITVNVRCLCLFDAVPHPNHCIHVIIFTNINQSTMQRMTNPQLRKHLEKHRKTLPSCMNSSKHLMVLAHNLVWIFTSFASHINHINLETHPILREIIIIIIRAKNPRICSTGNTWVEKRITEYTSKIII